MESRSKNLVEEEFITKLVPDPSQPPHVRLLTGYLGRSSRPGHSRLYLTPELSSYIDIPEGDILHSQSLKNEGNLLGGTLVWVKRDADLKSTTTRREMQADFLRGSIASQGMTGARASRVRLVPLLPNTFTVTECATCPTNDDRDTCFPATCTLTVCYTQVIVDPGCGTIRGFY